MTRFSTDPQFFLYVDDAYTGHDVTHDIRPPVGVKWSLNYVQIFESLGGGETGSMTIYLTDGTTTVILEYSTDMSLGSTVSWGSFGNGPLILTHDFYLQTKCTSNHGDAGSNIFHVAISVDVVN